MSVFHMMSTLNFFFEIPVDRLISVIAYLINFVTTLIPCVPTLIPRVPTLIPRVPTLIPHIPSLIPRVPIIPLILFPDSPLRLLEIALITLPFRI